MSLLSRLFGWRAGARPGSAGRAVSRDEMVPADLPHTPRGTTSAPVRGTEAAARESVHFDETGVNRTLRDGRVEYLAWDELEEVHLLTTDEGPFIEDVFWVLSGNGHGCSIGSTTEGVESLMSRLQQLPGFDNDAVVRAMGSTGNARFLCWQRVKAVGG